MPKLFNIRSVLTFLLTIFLVILVSHTLGQGTVKTLNPPQKLEGLNAPVVLSVIKDSKGFMWFFTPYGLVRYDGYNFKTYSNIPEDSTSMPGIIGISSMIVGADGNIWLGTQQNVLVDFDPVTEMFTTYPMDSTISDNYRNWISEMYVDQSGNLWLGTQYEGFYKFNPKEKTFKLYRQQNIEPIHDKDNILSFLEMDDNKLLVGSAQGLYVLDRQTDSIKPFTLAGPLPENFEKASFRSLLRDRNGAIWIGSNMGLFRFETDSGVLKQYVNEPNNLQSLYGNVIQYVYANPIDGGQTLWIIIWEGSEGNVLNRLDISTGIVERFVSIHDKPTNVYDYYLDKSGLLWMASDNQGVFFIDLKDNPFQHFTVNTGKSKDDNYSGSAFYRDSQGDFWVGTGQGGLFQYDAAENLKNRFKNLPGSAYSYPTMVYSILEDSRNNLWISYWSDFLYRRDPASGKFIRYKLKFPVVDLPFYRASEICEDKYGKVWVGSGNGVYFTDINKKDIEPFTWVANPAFGMSHTRSLCVDKSGTLWVTTDVDGLFCLSPENRDSMQFISYQHDPKIEGSISSNIVFSVYCSEDSTVWVGTGNGLNRFDPTTGTFDYFSMKNGFDAYFVYCVRTDGSGNVWVSTEKGLARFKPNAEEGKKFKLFSTRDGIPIDKIYPYHFDKGQDGRFYFGGERGFGLGYFSFHPDSIKDNTLIPSMTITGFKVKNETIQLDTAISYKKQLNLAYDQNFISFEFASLDFNNPEMNRYAYLLEGYDEDWIYSDNHRFANYTGLSPGKYTFRVIGSNNDGYWNETGASIKITIATPPWKTWWAYLLYTVFALGVLLIIIRYYFRRQHLLHQLELEHLESDKLKEIDSLKSKFFANISHEFRTPLTLILGPVNKLRELIKDKVIVRDLDMMERNANQLKRLINQILDLTKLEAGKLQLKTTEINIVQLIKSYIQSFESLARQKNIGFNFHSDDDDIIVYADKEKLEQIMNNLLANSFKYTSDGDNILVSIKRDKFPGMEKDAIKIEIMDSGQGISKKDLPYLFDRFYQAGDNKNSQGGTGIGLTLVKELVELHHGIIEVVSESGIGTTFSIYLLIGTEHLKESEIIISTGKPEDQLSEDLTHEEKYIIETDNDIRDEQIKYGLATMLIVEDNDDMRSYIRGHFEKSYQIIEAVNGKEGFDKAIEYIPDIIVSDVMMPEMNGNEMSKLIKSDQRSSHIPVILLTARSSGADKIEGLETGADDFITKPFDAKELQVRIKNLITQREKLKEYYKSKIASASDADNLQLENQDISSMDEQFLQKAFNTVEKHIADEQFSVEDFSLEMAFSRMQLHRKLKSLTGQSATEFIRTIRLKKAAALLASKSGTVTEIAYQVGFNSLSWFTKCFKEQYGLSPSEFKED